MSLGLAKTPARVMSSPNLKTKIEALDRLDRLDTSTSRPDVLVGDWRLVVDGWFHTL